MADNQKQSHPGQTIEYQGNINIKGVLGIWDGEAFVTISPSIVLFKEKYEAFTDLPETGPDALILVASDNGEGGDGLASQFIRQDNVYSYLVSVDAQ